MDYVSQTQCTTFTFLDDDVAEDTEIFFKSRSSIRTRSRSSLSTRHTYMVSKGEDERLEVCVELRASIEKEITVQFFTMAEMAHHYSDLIQEDSQLTFLPQGSTRVCTSIAVMDDQLLEDDEQFSVDIIFTDPTLYVPGHPSTSNTSAVVTISDNDYFTVTLKSSVYEVLEDVGQVSVCSILTGSAGKEVCITFALMQDTAQNGSDPGSIV